MQLQKNAIRIFFWLIIFSNSIWAQQISNKDIALGPNLSFEEQELIFADQVDQMAQEDMPAPEIAGANWHISILYVMPSKPVNEHPELESDCENIMLQEKKIIGTKYGWDFVVYKIFVEQNDQEQKVGYKLDFEEKLWHFVVPALGQEQRIMYHSCNGYQSEEDKEAVGGIGPMWEIISRYHETNPYHLRLEGGDQIYADGVVGDELNEFMPQVESYDHGVFALPLLQDWIAKKNNKYAIKNYPFDADMRDQVDKFYFAHYVDHYGQPFFKEMNASTPTLSQKDDHDVFDGCGSYPNYLQQSIVMAGIRDIANEFYYMVQHHREPLQADESLQENPLHFLKVVNDGKIAVLGVDTRSKRDQTQIVGEEEYEKIFQSLEKLGPLVKHLIVMLAVPVVYTDSESLIDVAKLFFNMPLVGNVAAKLPGIKNSFGLFELADDLRDGWGHEDHIFERNQLIARFQIFAKEKNIRVTFASGDVHLGGHGVIYHENADKHSNDPAVIHQIISSPVGNKPPSDAVAAAIGKKGKFRQDANKKHVMRLVRMRQRDDHSKKSHHLLARRNFASIILEENLGLDVTLTTEEKDQQTIDYGFKVPPPVQVDH